MELLAPLEVLELDNGMTFLLYPNKRAPIFTGLIRFDVGGKDEVPGQTGISHMFEHMAFKGTRNVGTTDWQAERRALEAVEAAAVAHDAARERLLAKGIEGEALAEQLAPLAQELAEAQQQAAQYVVKDEFDQIYSREGSAELNAFTSSDATVYFISLPSNRLELWARMESERLLMPVMREFYSERDVVLEERRMRRENSPVGLLWERTLAAAYIAHPYGYPLIGWSADLRNLKADAAYAFFRSHYTPDRATGVLVGDFDVERARELLGEHFGRIPARTDEALPRRILPEPPQMGERRIVVRRQASPTMIMGWHKPNMPHPADLRGEVLMEVLTGGRSARWFERFVKDEELAAEIGAFSGPGEAEPNMFMVYAVPAGDVALETLEAAIREDVERLRTEPVATEVLEHALKRLRAQRMRSLETNRGLAIVLAETAQLSGDPYYLERRLRQLESLTPEDLREFVAEYLTDDNLTVGWLEPPREESGEQP